MPQNTLSLEVTNDHAIPVEPLGGTATVLNVSGDTLYYADQPQVSSTNSQGSLTAGQSVGFTSPAWIVSAGLSTVTVTVVSGAGTTAQGLSPVNPIWLTNVRCVFRNYDKATKDLGNNYTYSNGANNDGIGATITSNVNGAMVADGITPAIGNRVLVSDPFSHANGTPPHPDGVYIVTAPGSVSTPWSLIRATDCDSAGRLGQYWAVQIADGTALKGGQAVVWALYDVVGKTSFVPGTDFLQLAIQGTSGTAIGPRTDASGNMAVSIGTQNSASGNNSVALGNTAQATGIDSQALGYTASAAGQAATALGSFCQAPSFQGFAYGVNACAWGDNVRSESSGQMSEAGDAQRSAGELFVSTTDATLTTLKSSNNKSISLKQFQGNTDWSKTLLLKATVVARRTDTPGTDSVWTFQGVLRGNGSSAYSWIGGSAPTATLVAQDAGASTWTVVMSMSSNTLVVQVTGAVGSTIKWMCAVETYEVKG